MKELLNKIEYIQGLFNQLDFNTKLKLDNISKQKYHEEQKAEKEKMIKKLNDEIIEHDKKVILYKAEIEELYQKEKNIFNKIRECLK